MYFQIESSFVRHVRQKRKRGREGGEREREREREDETIKKEK